MTSTERKALIEKAADAMYFEDCGVAALDDDAEPFRGMARAALAVFEEAHAPTDDEREALPVASPHTWGWDACVVCGSTDVTDRGMVVMVSRVSGPYVARIAWCERNEECRADLRQTSLLLSESDVDAIDAALRRTAVQEPSDGRAICPACGVLFRLIQHDEGCDVREQGRHA